MALEITLARAGVVLDLGPDLIWEDEFQWSPVVQTKGFSTTGALLIDVGVRQAGRPFTLVSGDGYAWLSHTTLQTLRAWAAMPAEVFGFERYGEAFQVMFDHSEESGFSARPVAEFSDPQGHDFYIVTLKLIEV